MVTEEHILSESELEVTDDKAGVSVPVSDQLAHTQPHFWGYPGVGLRVILLAMTLGALLGYLARPVLDSTIQRLPDSSSSIEQQVASAPAEEPNGRSKTQANSSAEPPTPTIMDFVLSDARHFQGDDNAPVTIVEFSDFKCPYCGRFSIETLPELRQVYIDTGQARLVFKHFSILGPESDDAAAATECAAEQGKFWEYHDQIYADQATTRSTLNHDQLTSLAEKSGLSTSAFADCLTLGRYANQVRRESEAVGAMGMRSTPSFLINGVFVVGAQPFEVFQQVIEEQLQASNQEAK